MPLKYTSQGTRKIKPFLEISLFIIVMNGLTFKRGESKGGYLTADSTAMIGIYHLNNNTHISDMYNLHFEEFDIILVGTSHELSTFGTFKTIWHDELLLKVS